MTRRSADTPDGTPSPRLLLRPPFQNDRVQRAKLAGVGVEDVPTAEPLTVRVINNVEKVLEVKQRFYEDFKADGQPERFKYKQKVRACGAMPPAAEGACCCAPPGRRAIICPPTVLQHMR